MKNIKVDKTKQDCLDCNVDGNLSDSVLRSEKEITEKQLKILLDDGLITMDEFKELSDMNKEKHYDK